MCFACGYFHIKEGARGVTVIFVRIEFGGPSLNPERDLISHCDDIFEKSMNPTILSSAIVRKTGLLNFDMATCRGERKL